ncbi:helix-turn-helix domain-containing protein [Ilyomonas limi]|jgi:transposase|uniref:Helix-turn-helix domain-containing protein n=1 Tax=Ilyomonas limi TaxID=2575867 RepID=A0A4U3KQN5_9BACT|nr:helix-turn-helix domain-containing protein [Ilyomonas limi]TKK63929.1 helix-turn-helix domain-containing protein [Ilyomonas limi]
MAKAKGIRVKETPQQLKQLLKQQSKAGLRNRIIMLQQIQKSKTALSKNELAELAGVNHNSIQKWRRLYETGGMSALLEHKQGGKRRAVITAVAHTAIEKKLKSPSDAFVSFEDLRRWVDMHLIPGIKYVTLNAYVKKHFGAKLKVARKSHIQKDMAAAEQFKKNERSL